MIPKWQKKKQKTNSTTLIPLRQHTLTLPAPCISKSCIKIPSRLIYMTFGQKVVD